MQNGSSHLSEESMTWKTPKIVEVAVGLERYAEEIVSGGRRPGR
jgi:hypothetical protein